MIHTFQKSISLNMAPRNKVILLECCQAAPPPGTVSEMSHPLTFSDMLWVGFSPVQRLIFYEHPVSRSKFTNTIIPQLKNSFSLALKHFPSLSGNLIIPSPSESSSRPEIHFVDGNSVPLIFAESSFPDFDFLVSNQPRNCTEFYPLVPQVPESSESSGGEKVVPLFAVQVTLFPGAGICIGIANLHVAGDGNSMYAFVRAWAEITKSGGDDAALGGEFSPVYDRSMMRDHTKKLDEFFWNHLRKKSNDDMVTVQLRHPEDSDKVRATFVVDLEDVQRLKKHVLDKQQPPMNLKHVSTYTVVCSYVWACMVKSGNAALNEEVGEDEGEHFVSVADCRGRTNPEIPRNYFGNCLAYFCVNSKNGELSGDGGFLNATGRIGEAIYKRLQNQGGVFEGLDELFKELGEVNWGRTLSVAGSPRQNYYNMDFGWGKPRKFEFVSIDQTGAISLSGCGRDAASGGLEIGLALPEKRMEAFSQFFEEGLKAV